MKPQIGLHSPEHSTRATHSWWVMVGVWMKQSLVRYGSLGLAALMMSVVALPAMAEAPAESTAVAATPVSELLASLGANPNADMRWIDALVAQQGTTVPDVDGVIGAIDAAHALFASADSPAEAVLAYAKLNGYTPATYSVVSSAPDLAAQILLLYDSLGLDATSAQILELQSSIASLAPNQVQALQILLTAIQGAMVLQQDGTYADLVDAAVLILGAVDAATSALQTPTPAGAMACTLPFEDPLFLIRLGSECADTVNETARLLLIDPGGDDQYLGNAGGAFPTGLTLGSGAINPYVTSEHVITEVLDHVQLNPLFPLAPTNSSWQANASDYAAQFVANNTDSEVADFMQDFVNGIEVHAEINQSRLRNVVPIAVHVDMGGSDSYSSMAPVVQGSAAAGGIGILIDRGTDGDSYTCGSLCQGYALGGVGILADEGGPDSYSALNNAQGSTDLGILIDLGGSDIYSSGFGSQGASASILVPAPLPAMLLDRSGDDSYTSNSMGAQGAAGLLFDLAGNDHYSSETHSQGASYAFSRGVLLDAAGDDVYQVVVWGQGAALGPVPGVLADLAGNDAYIAGREAQGYGATSAATGLLYDRAGADAYTAGSRTQGFGEGAGAGFLVDHAGNDAYAATSLAQGAGSTRTNAPGLGALIDVAGDDSYSATEWSQGSTQFFFSAGATGLLYDGDGTDAYNADANSQGSGGSGGLGILVDAASNAGSVSIEEDSVQVTADVGASANWKVKVGSTKVEGSLEPSSASPLPDSFSAAAYSQGSSGIGGGIGVLYDAADEAIAPATFVAGNYSQGSATATGVGFLVNRGGDDSYTAGSWSQGASDNGLGVLIETEGNDVYASGAANSQGAANGVGSAGFLVDLAGDDGYDTATDNSCASNGVVGLLVDSDGTLPANCPTVAADLVADVVDSAVNELMSVLFPSGGSPPTGTIYFSEGFETGMTGWTTSSLDGVTTWRVVNDSLEPQATPNAFSGGQYAYVGLPVAGVGYTPDAVATMTSPSIDLTTATAPELRVAIGGTSELDFDFLRVFVVDEDTSVSTEVLELSDSRTNNPAPTYTEYTIGLSGYTGGGIHLVFEFTSDSLIEDGQGWNVDDVLVIEA